MSGGALGALGFFVALVLIVFEVPVGVSMAVVGILGSAYVLGGSGVDTIVATTLWDSFTNYTLSVLPLFVLMGHLATATGLSSRLYTAMRALVGHCPSGLALSTIGASAGFGMISGSSLATTATMSKLSIPEMVRAGYRPDLAGGTVAAGGTLGIMIPPSTIIVVYAFIASQSIKDLFLAAMVPAALAVLFYCLAIIIQERLKWSPVPRIDRAAAAERRQALKDVLPVFSIFALIMGGLYGGIFTANETAAMGVILVFAYGIVSRTLSPTGFLKAVYESVGTSASLYLIVFGANLFNFFLTLSGLPFSLTGIFSGLELSALQTILVMLVIYFLLGTLMDSLAMLLLTVPLFVPIAQAAGIDLVWFGIFVLVVVEVGLITPPVGMNLFVIKAGHRDLSLVDLWRGVTPFVLVDAIRIALLIAIPQLVLWLPQHAG
jgi:tripartite ATP-independent transporter DctM subunit